MGLFNLSKSRRKPIDTGSDQSPVLQNRLSKPKTNTNSPTLFVDSTVSIYSRRADLVVSPSEKGSGSTTWSDKEVDTGEPAAHVRGRSSTVVSRANSVANQRRNSLSFFSNRRLSVSQLPDPPGQENSLASSAQMDVEAAIRLLQEVKKNASPEDLAALRAALGSSTDITIPAEPGLSRQTSIADQSCSSLTRRRSLVQTPGIATRNSPVEDHRSRWRSWKTPQVEPEQEAKWLANPIHSPPQNQLVALDLAEEDNYIPTIRSQTPGDMEYSQLGTFKLGTLSVINGAPSPAPSTVVPAQASHYPAQQDYFSTAKSGASPTTTKNINNRGHTKSKSSILPTTPPLYHAYQLPENGNRARSSLRYNITNGPQETYYEDAPSIPQEDEDVDVPLNATTLAKEYQAGIPSSPFKRRYELDSQGEVQRSTSGDSIPSIEAINDALYYEHAATVEAPKPIELHAATGNTISERRRNLLIARPLVRSADTADSGYSSGSSQGLSHAGSRESQLSTSTTRSAPAPQNTDNINVRQRTTPITSILKVPSVKSRYSLMLDEPTREIYQRPASLQISSELLESAAPFTVLSPKSPRSGTSLGSSDGASPRTPRRLQKRRQSQPQPPVIPTCQSIREDTDVEVPDVPSNVQAKFARRLSQTPGIECLTNTFASTNHIIANEFVDDFPDPTPTEFINHLAQIEPQRTPTPPPLVRKRSLSLFRRKKAAAEDREAETGHRDVSPTVLDLGTIASALGCSPYDAAMSGSPRRKPTTAPTHPHQLGNATPRPKSTVKMDAETAAELARIRSKDRAVAEVELPQSQRRQRSHYNLKSEAGEGKPSKRNLRIVHDDIPPVPSINTAKMQVSIDTAKKQTETQVPHTAMSRSRNEDRKIHKSNPNSHGSSPRSVLVASELYNKEHEEIHDQSQDDIDWEVHSRHWRQHRRKSMGDGLHGQSKAPESSTATVNFRTTQTSGEPMQRFQEPMAWDRYSGGLDFEYEGRGAGVGGSAGTRQVHSHASSKSMQWRHQYGVDLSDVPVFLQRA